MRVAAVALLLTGCTYAQVSEIDRPGNTNIYLADKSDGKPAVTLHFVSPARGQPLHIDSQRRSLSLRPGRYTLSVECYRPGAHFINDATDLAEIDVPETGAYMLDCAPSAGENNFGLRNR